MAFEQRPSRRQKIRYNSDNDDNPIVYQLIVNGAKVTPDSATIAISNPSGTEVLAATAMTASGTLLTYSVDTTTVATWPVGEGYRADIVVTYNSKTYDRHLVIDVAKYLLDINIGEDQLEAMDDSLQGMRWNGDGDFSALIEAARDYMQVRIEAKVVDDDKLLENMILDHTGISVSAAQYIISKIHLAKNNLERYQIWKDEFESTFDAVLRTIRYDSDGDGTERDQYGGLTTVRLRT